MPVAIVGIAEQQQIEDIWFTQNNQDGRIVARLLVSPEKRQKVLDALQTIFHNADNYHVLIIPLDTALPKPVETETPADKPLSAERIRIDRETEGIHDLIRLLDKPFYRKPL